MARWPKVGDEVTFDVHTWPPGAYDGRSVEVTGTVVTIGKYSSGLKRYAVTSTDRAFTETFPFKTRMPTGEHLNITYKRGSTFKTFGIPNIDTEEKLTRLLEMQYG